MDRAEIRVWGHDALPVGSKALADVIAHEVAALEAEGADLDDIYADTDPPPPGKWQIVDGPEGEDG